MAIVQLLLFLGFLTAFSDEGVGIDPFGVTITSDEGSGLDPHGRPIRTYEGNGFDPHGTPRTTSDNGCGIDPNGGACSDAGLRIDDNG